MKKWRLWKYLWPCPRSAVITSSSTQPGRSLKVSWKLKSGALEIVIEERRRESHWQISLTDLGPPLLEWGTSSLPSSPARGVAPAALSPKKEFKLHVTKIVPIYRCVKGHTFKCYAQKFNLRKFVIAKLEQLVDGLDILTKRREST